MQRFSGILFCLWLHVCNTVANVSDDDYKKLLPVYDMDNYTTCNIETHIYCKMKLILFPDNVDNELWRIIKAAKTDRRYMSRDIIYRARCISKQHYKDNETFFRYITNLENEKLRDVHLHAKVENVDCNNNVVHLVTWDYFILWLLLGYAAVVVLATIADCYSRRKHKTHGTRRQDLVKLLSVRSNWEELKRSNTNANHKRLKSIQGIRMFMICVVVATHSMLLATATFIANPNFLEEFLGSTFKRVLTNIVIHIVQPSFLISGWLLAVQVYNAMDRNNTKILTLNMIIRDLTYRYLRFVVPLLIYILLQSTSLLNIFFVGPHTEYFYIEQKACRTYWWANLLLINNNFFFKNICNAPSWYLSLDFQARVLCMALFYLMFRYKLGIKVFGVALVAVAATNAYTLYNAFMSHLVPVEVTGLIKADDFKLDTGLETPLLYVYHSSSVSNLGSYLVGILFGTLYHKYKNTNVKINKLVTIFWILGYFGLQALVVALTLFQYPPIVAAIIGALLKPLFSAGVAIGILGMSHNVGGCVKRFLECDFFEFLSRWISSVFLFHIPLVLYKTAMWTHLVELSYVFLVRIALTDIVLAFAIGLILHLTVERPLSPALKIIKNWIYKQKIQ